MWYFGKNYKKSFKWVYFNITKKHKLSSIYNSKINGRRISKFLLRKLFKTNFNPNFKHLAKIKADGLKTRLKKLNFLIKNNKRTETISNSRKNKIA